MVWKSNLDESEQEFIEEFGAKETKEQAVPAPTQKRPTTAKKTAGKFNTGRKTSPAKSIAQST